MGSRGSSDEGLDPEPPHPAMKPIKITRNVPRTTDRCRHMISGLHNVFLRECFSAIAIVPSFFEITVHCCTDGMLSEPSDKNLTFTRQEGDNASAARLAKGASGRTFPLCR
jgi:hypothetical protein